MNLRRFALPILLVMIWAGVSAVGAVNPLLLPSPWSVLKFGLSVGNGQGLIADIGSSCLRLVTGFVLGGAIGVAFGIAMGASRRVYEALEFLIDFFRSIPVAALLPLFVTLLGIGNTSKIFSVAWSTALVVLVNTMYGVRSCSPVRQRFARTVRATRYQTLLTIIIPEAMPSILAGLRNGLSIALIVVILSEMFLGTSSGLGYRVYNAAQLYATDELYFTIALVGILGFLSNQGFVALEGRLLRWQSAVPAGNQGDTRKSDIKLF